MIWPPDSIDRCACQMPDRQIPRQFLQICLEQLFVP